VHRTPRQHNLGTEGWNRTNVEGSKDLRPAIERPRHGTPGWTRTSVYRFRRAMPESPRPQARSQFECWYRGRGSNSTAPLCRRGALNQKATPAYWLWGQDSNLRMNWLTASRLTTWLPHKTWSGTSDLNRDSLGPRPSGLIRFPSPRMSKIWSERLESNQRPRASETRALIQLSYAHKNTGTGGRGRTGISSLGPKCSIR
jgi:hypothetical protein